MVDRKHITEATDKEIADQIRAVAEYDPDSHDFIGPDKAARMIRTAFDFSAPQPPEGVAELIDEIRGRFKNREIDWESRLIHEAADALEALSSVPPVRDLSDEELLAEYEAAWAATPGGIHKPHLAGLRAVAALSSTEGTGQ